MNATELFLADARPAGLFFCSKCRRVAINATKANACCLPTKCSCGAECDTGWSKCRMCRLLDDSDRDRKRFEAAEKVTEWNGWVYAEGMGLYFPSIDDLLEECENEALDVPDYVWTCTPNQFIRARAQDLLKDIDDAYEEFDSSSIVGMDALIAACKAFNAANKHHVSYTPDYTKAVLIPKQVTK